MCINMKSCIKRNEINCFCILYSKIKSLQLHFDIFSETIPEMNMSDQILGYRVFNYFQLQSINET